jgi:hypothetical protein
MPLQTWQETFIQAQSDGTAVTSTGEGSLLPGQAKFTLPANFLDYVGKTLRVRASGRISNIVTTPGTLTLRVKFGAIIVAASSAMQLNTTAQTNVTWWLEWALTARTIGATTAATLMHTGIVTTQSAAVGASPLVGTWLIPASAPAVGTGFDSTVANVVDLTAQFSLTGNSIQLHQYALESIN